MIFAERKTEAGYNYVVDDAFGTISIDSTTKLDGDTLDSMVMLLMHQGGGKVLTGTVRHDDGVVAYTYTKRDQWADDDMMELCKDTPTKTKKQARPSTVIDRYVTPIYSWCNRFVAAFREAWRRSANR